MKWLGGKTHSFIFPHKPNISFSPNLRGIRLNEIEFNGILTEIPIMQLFILQTWNGGYNINA